MKIQTDIIRMKQSQVIISLCVLFSLFSIDKFSAQTKVATVQNIDSIASGKGNLSLLVDRIYLAFKAYRTGMNEFDKEQKLDKAHIDSLQNKGWHVDVLLQNEKQILPVIIKKDKLIDTRSYLNKIPLDSVQSIEVMDNGAGITALYGLSSYGIVIRLKD